MRHRLSFLPLAAALALSGCISFGAKPPERLMRLTPAATVPAATSRTATAEQTITVVEPTVPQELATMRVPVRSHGTALAYLKDAQWVDEPGALFGRLLAETIAATTGRVVLDPRQFTLDPGTRLTGQLQEFGLDADRMEVVAIYDAALARGTGTVETRRFEARIPIAQATEAAVAPALNDAANQVAAEVAQWIGGGVPDR
jgi:cholesterol transport system auxiliary component